MQRTALRVGRLPLDELPRHRPLRRRVGALFAALLAVHRLHHVRRPAPLQGTRRPAHPTSLVKICRWKTGHGLFVNISTSPSVSWLATAAWMCILASSLPSAVICGCPGLVHPSFQCAAAALATASGVLHPRRAPCSGRCGGPRPGQPRNDGGRDDGRTDVHHDDHSCNMLGEVLCSARRLQMWLLLSRTVHIPRLITRCTSHPQHAVRYAKGTPSSQVHIRTPQGLRPLSLSFRAPGLEIILLPSTIAEVSPV